MTKGTATAAGDVLFEFMQPCTFTTSNVDRCVLRMTKTSRASELVVTVVLMQKRKPFISYKMLILLGVVLQGYR